VSKYLGRFLSYPKPLDSPIVQVDCSWPTGGHELSGTRGRFVCIMKFSGDLNHDRNTGLEIKFGKFDLWKS